MLGLDGDQVTALVLVEVSRTLDGQVNGFGCAGGPDEFFGVGGFYNRLNWKLASDPL